jgi:biopolymer transport protein TolR
MRLARKSDKPISRIDMRVFTTVFIVVALTLLTIFMTLTQPAVHGVRADLPKACSGSPMRGADREDAISVVILRDGTIFVGRGKVQLNSLSETIREQSKQARDKKVYIRADARARSGSVADVLDALREAGVRNIAFIVDQKRTPPL